jgi:TolB-like protein
MRYSGIMKSIRPTLCLVLLILAVTHAFGQTRTISVLYFENTTKNADYAWFSKGAADMLITGLAAAPEISVIEREQLQKIIQQQEATSMTRKTPYASASL